jgi:hypothetical protein
MPRGKRAVDGKTMRLERRANRACCRRDGFGAELYVEVKLHGDALAVGFEGFDTGCAGHFRRPHRDFRRSLLAKYETHGFCIRRLILAQHSTSIHGEVAAEPLHAIQLCAGLPREASHTIAIDRL